MEAVEQSVLIVAWLSLMAAALALAPRPSAGGQLGGLHAAIVEAADRPGSTMYCTAYLPPGCRVEFSGSRLTVCGASIPASAPGDRHVVGWGPGYLEYDVELRGPVLEGPGYYVLRVSSRPGVVEVEVAGFKPA